MKVYRVELLVLDFENSGKESITIDLEQSGASPYVQVMEIESKDIGEWSDDHPLNISGQQKEEYNRLFKNGKDLT
jgi:hypothetical protein